LKKLAITFISIVAFAGALVIASVWHTSSRRTKAGAIKVGDTKAQVEGRLGRATMVTPFSTLWRTNAAAALFCDTAETWGYGSHFDFQSGFPWLRLRLFLPDPDDIVVEFGTSGRVVRVTLPPRKS
jgi:hypothetical protein